MKKSMRWFAFVLALLFALSPVSALQESMDAKYNHAHELLAEGKYEEAIRAFDEISYFSDSSKMAMYARAIAAAEGGDYTLAKETFTLLGDYKDCPYMIIYYNGRHYESQASGSNWKFWLSAADNYDTLLLFRDSRERAGKCRKAVYNAGVQKREAGEWNEAIEVFTHLEAYSDAATQISETRYQEGIAKREAQDWEGAVAAFKAAGEYNDAATQILETYYQQAKNHYDSGDYVDAYNVYQQIAGYKDVDNLLSTEELLLAEDAAAREAKLAPYKTVGSIVTFGHYEQDNNTGNGPEAIEWIVLDVQDGKSLLLSRYGLDAKPYHTEYKDITWEECSLRAWLNNDFLKGTFTPKEQSAILLTAVDNGKSQGDSDLSTSGGNNTQDHLFLLSYAEAKNYLDVTLDDGKNTKSCVAPTAYAKAQGAWTSDDNKTADGEAAGWWWLRSPGRSRSRAACVRSDGSLGGNGVYIGSAVVRPAFWLNLESDIF